MSAYEIYVSDRKIVEFDFHSLEDALMHIDYVSSIVSSNSWYCPQIEGKVDWPLLARIGSALRRNDGTRLETYQDLLWWVGEHAALFFDSKSFLQQHLELKRAFVASGVDLDDSL